MSGITPEFVYLKIWVAATNFFPIVIIYRFIYSGAWPITRLPVICLELYKEASVYEIQGLQKMCLFFIERLDATRHNAIDLYKHAVQTGNKDLLARARKFIAE